MEHYYEGYKNVTLQKIHDFCSIDEDHCVVYLHTKGAYHTRPAREQWHRHMTVMATSQRLFDAAQRHEQSLWMGLLSVLDLVYAR